MPEITELIGSRAGGKCRSLLLHRAGARESLNRFAPLCIHQALWHGSNKNLLGCGIEECGLGQSSSLRGRGCGERYYSANVLWRSKETRDGDVGPWKCDQETETEEDVSKATES